MTRLSDPEIDRLVAALNSQRQGAAAGVEGSGELVFEPVAEEEGGEAGGRAEPAAWAAAAATPRSVRSEPTPAVLPGGFAADDPGLARVPADGRLGRLLARMVEAGASDLLLVPGQPPVHRRGGKLERDGDEAQQLVPVGGGATRLPAVEVLLYNEVTLGKRHGMVSLEESLARMVRDGLLDPEEARLRASRPDELASLLTSG